MKRLLTLGGALLLGACASTPQATYVGCEPHILKWTFGPENDVPFLDMCYVQLDIGELKKYYTFRPILGNDPDTKQVIDANQDGIADGIRRDARVAEDRVYWGAACQQSALRVQQKGCTALGDSSRSAGCDWVAIHIQAKPGVKNQYVELTPVWHVRLPDGSEQSYYAKTLTTGVETCR